MVTKCFNLNCARSFLYLHEGRLFRLEPDPAFLYPPDFNPDADSVEYLWLCGECSELMTLCLDEQGHVVVKELAVHALDGPSASAVISRHNRMLLRTVTVERKRSELLRPRGGTAAIRRLTADSRSR